MSFSAHGSLIVWDLPFLNLPFLDITFQYLKHNIFYFSCLLFFLTPLRVEILVLSPRTRIWYITYMGLNIVIGGGTHTWKQAGRSSGCSRKLLCKAHVSQSPKVHFWSNFSVSSARLGYVLLADSYMSTPGKMSSIPELLEFWKEKRTSECCLWIPSKGDREVTLSFIFSILTMRKFHIT